MLSRNYKTDIDLRKKQIDTIKIFNQNVIEIIPNEEYFVGFSSNDRLVNITVVLGTNFPNELPRLVVKPILNHPWVDSISGEIRNAPGLLNYSIHSDLGRVVLAIIREFERSPPTIFNEPQQTNEPQPNEGCMFPQLNDLSIDELKKLDNDVSYLDDFIDEYGFIKSLNDEMNNVIYQVESLANENLSKKNILVETQNRVNEIVNKFKTIGENYEKLENEYKQKSEEFTPQHIQELLQIAVSTAESRCETYIDNFLKGKIDIQTFLTEYMEAKKLYSMRKAKEERLSIQLYALEKATY